MQKDRWNLAKFRILETLKQRGIQNSVELSEATRKQIYETTNVLKRLLKQRHIRAIVNTHKNSGCSHSYKLTPRGKRYLLDLEQRFRRGEDLNFKYIGEKIDYPSEVLAWAQRTIPPPNILQYTGTHHDLKLTRLKKEKLIIDNIRELHLFEDGADYRPGDTFDIRPFYFYIYYVERFNLVDYAQVFSKYRKPKAPAAYYKKLQDIYPNTNTAWVIYFKRIHQTPLTNPTPSTPPQSEPVPVRQPPVYTETKVIVTLADREPGWPINLNGVVWYGISSIPTTLPEAAKEFKLLGYASGKDFLDKWAEKQDIRVYTERHLSRTVFILTIGKGSNENMLCNSPL